MSLDTVSLDTIVQDLNNLKISSLVELKTRLEKEWGVSAQTIAAADAQTIVEVPEVEEQLEFNVQITAIGPRKIEVIKAVRELNPALTLVESKTVVESTPVTIAESVDKERAQVVCAKLEAAGAEVSVT